MNNSMKRKDFEKYARSRGISSTTLGGYVQSRGRLNPNIMESNGVDAVPMDVFTRLQMDNIIFLGSEIDDDVANIINAQLLYLSNNCNEDETIKLYLNTPGGMCHAGLSIYDTMNIIPQDVSTICIGMAASMGSVLLVGGAEGKRMILPHSKVLIHQPLGGAEGQASDILIAAKEIEKTRAELIRIISERSGQSYEKVFADADRDFWMNAQEAVEYGIVDEILSFNKNK